MQAKSKPTPRRPIEREYLVTLNADVPLDTWQAIYKGRPTMRWLVTPSRS
jgi:hypothetical protein